MKRNVKQSARRPVSYADALTTGPCEGRPASPSNPNRAAKQLSNAELTERMIFRCTALDKARITALAQNSARSQSEIFREALGLASARRPRPIPKADPALLRQVAGIGNNLNQIARGINKDARHGAIKLIDATILAAELVAIERALMQTVEDQSN